MILCFSGTGNSRYIAKQIADELQDKIVDVNAKIKATDYSPIKTGDNVIVVTPTYAWRIPPNCVGLAFQNGLAFCKTYLVCYELRR